MIVIKKINKFYRVGNKDFQALKDVTLTISRGELIAIQGRSGAGKSTLLHILAFLDSFESGNFLFNGKSAMNLKDNEMASIRGSEIGIVMQDFALINHKSVLYNVMIPMLFDKTPYKNLKARALEALQIVGLKDECKKNANQLSGGQRQRVAIARAIVNKPSLLLCDEPTGSLDTQTGTKIIELLKDINSSGTTVIIVTHDNNIAQCCKRIILIEDGVIKQ